MAMSSRALLDQQNEMHLCNNMMKAFLSFHCEMREMLAKINCFDFGQHFHLIRFGYFGSSFAHFYLESIVEMYLSLSLSLENIITIPNIRDKIVMPKTELFPITMNMNDRSDGFGLQLPLLFVQWGILFFL